MPFCAELCHFLCPQKTKIWLAKPYLVVSDASASKMTKLTLLIVIM